MLRIASPLRVLVVALGTLASCALVAACTAQVTPVGGSSGAPPTAATNPAPVFPPGADAGSSMMNEGSDGGTGGNDAAPSTAMLSTGSASYQVSAGTTTTVYAITFDIADTASEDVVSLDTMRFDFGGGAVVSLTASACEGSFPISAGGQQAVTTQVVVHADGTVQPADFSIQCPDHQSFGGAKGTGPIGSTFAGPIAITIGGKTAGGAFTGVSSATRSP
jgi:hypothetical protein